MLQIFKLCSDLATCRFYILTVTTYAVVYWDVYTRVREIQVY